ncbi:hypothetical protein Kpol_513p1 [Vanderwaltozyma polyspora DSM 70294]|uniref:Uncharacterized protein n=1 Tax=Vanderwaltozyma polyspora (strain ATCC 22028 / DSM 70294 / BCRC 21397 / CBS 2163 / NBRC 10782 / NRRL Y-8283 / UCD 57-17) TaxID=436907 RepID=A7TMI7_VANPO|nr:uncharacterized protein Kpol_513p1 [Vanderwaltozyma polyspora DSM 70294]EDO16485.1 hypothetical protein Kpol_513p1 [Vanderwaltozyma polyspora DSM 70294]
MILRLSKRLIRLFFFIIGFSVILLFSLHDDSQKVLKSYLPNSLDISQYVLPVSSNTQKNKLQEQTSHTNSSSSNHNTNANSLQYLKHLEELRASDPLFYDEQDMESFSDEDWMKEQERLQKDEENFELAMENALKIKANATQNLGKNSTLRFMEPVFVNRGRKPKACFLFTINKHSKFQTLEDIITSVEQLESRFNKQFNYPYVFINETPFTSEEKLAIQNIVSSDVNFGLIPESALNYPGWIDQNKAATARSRLYQLDMGSSESYRFIQRYLSGLIWRHELLEPFDWYWRIEPNMKINCDMQYDIFRWMQDTGNIFGFTLSKKEPIEAMPTIWDTLKSFQKQNPDFIADKNFRSWADRDNGNKYNTCEFLSSFEVASLEFWRSPAFKALFDYLDHKGGFFYERWSESAVHTLATIYLLPKDRIHFFPEIGYSYDGMYNCPLDDFIWKDNNCVCDQGNDFTFAKNSCTGRYYEGKSIKKPEGWHQRA